MPPKIRCKGSLKVSFDVMITFCVSNGLDFSLFRRIFFFRTIIWLHPVTRAIHARSLVTQQPPQNNFSSRRNDKKQIGHFPWLGPCVHVRTGKSESCSGLIISHGLRSTLNKKSTGRSFPRKQLTSSKMAFSGTHSNTTRNRKRICK